ncbi:hypothetical protein TNCT_118081 [Trichonephila clavata]|uniref:Uncharacterized protein n=1 Tax=Trichonephila clavata TaxID=2740835 RepID=A0A8X6K1U9_TRICU|nr:hypothetical protein TNCT_118081 [Trichonephila clavata]
MYNKQRLFFGFTHYGEKISTKGVETTVRRISAGSCIRELVGRESRGRTETDPTGSITTGLLSTMALFSGSRDPGSAGCAFPDRIRSPKKVRQWAFFSFFHTFCFRVERALEQLVMSGHR